MIAQYPPMGWNSWDCYGAAVTEETVRANADYMAKNLKQYGWEYVVVDIQWYQPTADSHEYIPFAELGMDEYGRLLPAVNRFPSAKDGKGFTALAEYVHGLGLKFGIHIMRGMPRMAAHRHLPILNSQYGCHEAANPNSVCMWNPDMYGLKCSHPGAQAYYDSLFQLYASWGVDFVKVDDIAREYPHCEKEIEVISKACRNCGRDMVLSLSPGPAPIEKAEHLKKYANMWRLTDDMWDRWDLVRDMFDRASRWCIHTGPGRWPDCDMLPLGAIRQVEDPAYRCKLTFEEQRTLMTLWCIFRSPLMYGGDLAKMDDDTLSLITNEKVLAMLNESCCAHPLYTVEEGACWVAPRADGTGYYVALFNFEEKEQAMSIELAEAGIPSGSSTELWTGVTAENACSLSAKLPAHGAAVWFVQR